METSKNNELIALFIGMQPTSLGWFDSEEILQLKNTKDNTFDELLFNKDWNWLMSVVRFMCNEDNIKYLQFFDKTPYITRVGNSLYVDYDIDGVFKDMVTCIKIINIFKEIETKLQIVSKMDELLSRSKNDKTIDVEDLTIERRYCYQSIKKLRKDLELLK